MKGEKLSLFGLATATLMKLLFGGVDITKADQLYIEFTDRTIPNSVLTVEHTSGATEGYDNGLDSLFLEFPFPPALDIYSKTNFPYPHDRLGIDSRPPESMTTINAEICGRGLSNPVDNELSFYIEDIFGENIFDNKVIIADLYNPSGALLGTYDVKYMFETEETIPITVNEGLSYYLKIRFYNIEDLNRDRIVNFRDFAEFAEVYGTSGHSVNDNWADGADFDHSGCVDTKDLATFVNGWLLETQSVCGE